MDIKLNAETKESLERQHKTEGDGRVRDRIKAVLLHVENWSQLQIAQALRIRPETVHDHLNDYLESQKLKPENGGSHSQIDNKQSQELIQHLESHTYVKVSDICGYVEEKYETKLSVPGMTKWLKRNDFSYKKPKATPAKANISLQAEFIDEYTLRLSSSLFVSLRASVLVTYSSVRSFHFTARLSTRLLEMLWVYNKLINETPLSEPIEFGDGVHPTMATKVVCGWIRKGKAHDKVIATIASRTRMNLMGSINLETMDVTIDAYETIDSNALSAHFKKLREKYPNAPKIHQILDRGSYNTSAQTKEAAAKYGVALHFLPPYSPNLNPIERLWKVMNEHARNNKVFKSAREFRESIMHFFNVTWTQIAKSMTHRINDNFQLIKRTFRTSL